MLVCLDLQSPELRHSCELFARAVRAALETVALVNYAFLTQHECPPLLDSDVVYGEEPPGVEEFVDVPVVRSRGWGDCAHLSAWRVAELRISGEPAAFAIEWVDEPHGRVFHVMVRRGNGDIEDTSALLGMPT